MALQTTMMDSTCLIRRPTVGRDGVGGTTLSFSPGLVITSNLACSLQEMDGTVKELYAQRNIFKPVTLYFYLDPGCQANDRAEVTESRSGALHYVNIMGKAQPVARSRIWQAEGEEIDQPT